MSDKPGAAAVLYAMDLGRMRAFYEAVLGWEVVHAGDDHAILETAAFQLILQAIPASIAETIESASPPERRTETPIKLVFPIDSIREARDAAAAHGGELDAPEREWRFRTDRVCDGHDPEGNVVQFRERMAPSSGSSEE